MRKLLLLAILIMNTSVVEADDKPVILKAVEETLSVNGHKSI
jgi:hypothetical protein